MPRRRLRCVPGGASTTRPATPTARRVRARCCSPAIAPLAAKLGPPLATFEERPLPEMPVWLAVGANARDATRVIVRLGHSSTRSPAAGSADDDASGQSIEAPARTGRSSSGGCPCARVAGCGSNVHRRCGVSRPCGSDDAGTHARADRPDGRPGAVVVQEDHGGLDADHVVLPLIREPATQKASACPCDPGNSIATSPATMASASVPANAATLLMPIRALIAAPCSHTRGRRRW